MAASQDWFLEQARLGNMYHACSAGAVTLSTVSTTCTGLALSNTYGSGKLLVVNKIRFAPSTIPAGISVVGIAIHTALSSTDTTHTTPMVIHNAIASGNVSGSPAGRADAAATLASTPLWLRPIAVQISGSTTTAPVYEDFTNGQIIIAPGGCLSLSYLTTAAVGICSVTWVEVKA
jgi:hypothetical protein